MPPANSPVMEESPPSVCYDPLLSPSGGLLTLNPQLLNPAGSSIPQLSMSPEPARTPSPSTFLPALRDLGRSPVLDLASTLTLQAEEDVDDDNISFLRAPPSSRPEDTSIDAAATDAIHELRTERRRTHTQNRERMATEETRERRLYQMRQLELLRRHRVENNDSSHTVPLSRYSSNVPSHQSLYDWAPAPEDGTEAELENILAELRQIQPNAHPDILRYLGRAQLDQAREQRLREHHRFHVSSEQRSSTTHEPSLRSQAVQNIRRNHRLGSLSGQQRDHVQRFLLARELARNNTNSSSNSSESSNSNPVSGPTTATNSSESRRSPVNVASTTTFRPHASDIRGVSMAQWREELRAREMENIRLTEAEAIERWRRRYLEEPAGTPIEKAMQTLHRLRAAADSIQDWAKTRQTDESRKADITDRERLSQGFPIPQTSWLSSGNVFSGYQQTAQPAATVATQLANADANASSRADPFDATRPWLSRTRQNNPIPAPFSAVMKKASERWTVKMAIHDVDYETGTVQGTMEAFNVPSFNRPSISSDISPLSSTQSPICPPGTSHPASAISEKTFSTFVVGELIDFTNHTLITESFKAGSRIDATYWRKLQPFTDMDDEEVAEKLVNPRWIEEELQSKYVLMRWKEKCFVKATATNRVAQHQHQPIESGEAWGLSIQGFYYVSLRRSDGKVHGLYYDPESTPYQQLNLQPEATYWNMPGFEFR